MRERLHPRLRGYARGSRGDTCSRCDARTRGSRCYSCARGDTCSRRYARARCARGNARTCGSRAGNAARNGDELSFGI